MSVAHKLLTLGMSKLPRMAKLKDGRFIPLEEVSIGSTLILYTGDIISIDGLVSKGKGEVDESAATGEYKPKEKTEGDKVMAGSIVYSG